MWAENTLCVTLLQSSLSINEIKWKRASSPSFCWLCSFSSNKEEDYCITPSLCFCPEIKREPGQLEWRPGQRAPYHCLLSGLDSLAELPTQVQHEGDKSTSTWHLSQQTGGHPDVPGGLRKEHMRHRTEHLPSVPPPCNAPHMRSALGQSKH